jgi:hypothetical protein
VLVQNGIGFEDNHRQRHPKIPILSAVTFINAEQLKPNLIKHNRWTRISIGPYHNFSSYILQPHPPVNPQLVTHSQSQLKLLVTMLRKGGIDDAEMHSEKALQIVRWHKLAIKSVKHPYLTSTSPYFPLIPVTRIPKLIKLKTEKFWRGQCIDESILNHIRRDTIIRDGEDPAAAITSRGMYGRGARGGQEDFWD